MGSAGSNCSWNGGGDSSKQLYIERSCCDSRFNTNTETCTNVGLSTKFPFVYAEACETFSLSKDFGTVGNTIVGGSLGGQVCNGGDDFSIFGEVNITSSKK